MPGMLVNSRKVQRLVPQMVPKKPGKPVKENNVTIAEISFNDGKMNTFDFDAVDALRNALEQADEDEDVRAVVLTGNEKVFSAGFDLKIMRSPNVGKLTCHGFDMLEYIFQYPKPLVFAVRGHCMALGGMMMCCADYNVGSATLAYRRMKNKSKKCFKPCKIGLNETAIGMVMPSAGVEYTRFRCPPPHFHLNQAVGVIRDAQGALKTGYLDEVQPFDQTLERAHEVAAQFGASVKMHAFAANKLLTRRPTLEYLAGARWQNERKVMLNMAKL